MNNKPTVEYVSVPEPKEDDYATEPTNYVQLLMALARAKDPARLHHLVTAYSDRFDAVHLAAAIVRLPKVLQYRAQDVVARDVVLPGLGVPRYLRRHDAKLRASHAGLGVALVRELDAMVPKHVAGFYPRQAASVVWSFGELSRKGVLPEGAPTSLPNLLLVIKRDGFEFFKVRPSGAVVVAAGPGRTLRGYLCVCERACVLCAPRTCAGGGGQAVMCGFCGRVLSKCLQPQRGLA